MSLLLDADRPHAVSAVNLPTSRWLARAGLAFILVIALFGIVARQQMLMWGLVRPGPVNVYFRLYALHERPLLLLLVVSTFIMLA